jgi:hypothetical protein
LHLENFGGGNMEYEYFIVVEWRSQETKEEEIKKEFQEKTNLVPVMVSPKRPSQDERRD